MTTKLATTHYQSDPINGLGPLGNTQSDQFELFNRVISIAIGIITVVAGIWFIFLIITGAIAYMSAGGDKGKLEEAQKRITTGLVGLIIVIAGFFIADLVGYLLGLNIIDPGGVLSTLRP